MTLTFAINQRTCSVPDDGPELEFNLLQFLRAEGYTGCKQVCGEGGCGSCTAVLSRWDQARGKATHQSVAACLVPLPFVHQMHVTTIEGLTKLSIGGIHPLSEAFYEMGASQCGFCTPGFIMSFAARLAQDESPTKADLEHVFDGSLCRCTGYRPIMDAAAVFCRDPLESAEYKDKSMRWRSRMQSCRTLDDVFPDEFKTASTAQLFCGRGSSWAQPVALDEVLARVDEGDARIMAGNTDLGYTDRYRPKENRKTVFLHRVAELHQIEWTDEGIRIGAGVTIEQLAGELERRLPSLDEERAACLNALMSQCRFLGNQQIRSVATVGGGIVNFNHYSDLIPIWVVSGAQLVFRSSNGEEIKELLQSYDPGGDLDFDPKTHGVLTSIAVPFSHRDERVSNFKYSRRRLDSITLMSAGVRFTVAEDNSLKDIVLCLDGLGPPGLRAVKTEAFLKGKVWESQVLSESLHRLHDELSPRITNGLPRRLQNHQLRLAQAALLRVNGQYQTEFLERSGSRERALGSRYPKVAHRARAVFEEHSNGVVGRAIPHRHAKNQSTGEALYSNDREEANCLYASLVTSPVACGRLRSIDGRAALKHPDVVAFLSAKDIPGKNLFGFRVEDEEVLASQRVHFVGQAVGVLVAKSAQVAREQAWAVSVDVAEEDPILSIDRAIEEKSTHGRPDGYLLEQGNLDEGFSACALVVDGRVELPGQSHFYLEAQNALAIPREGGFRIYSSTQSPSNVVDHVSRLMDVSNNEVEVRVGRLGGGFGGKQLRAGPIAAICALAARNVNRPVKLTLDRSEDMAYCPGRSPAQASYRAGFDTNGRIRALDIDFYLSGGLSSDYSADIAETATLLMDSAYRIENIRVKGTCLKTNFGSGTATRGFGKPQSSAIVETIMDHGARALGN